MARDYYLFKHKNGFYYAEFWIDGSKRIVKSTKTKKRDTALLIIGDWLKNGLPAYKTNTKKPPLELLDYNAVMKYIEKSDIDAEQAAAIAAALKKRGLISFNFTSAVHGKKDFIKYLYEFWDYDNSIYLKDKRAHGKSITRLFCNDVKKRIKKNYEPYFENRTLADITRNDLRNFGLELKERLAGKTVNNIMQLSVTALKWAYLEKLIPEDITEKIGGFSGDGKKRDTFETAEIEKLNDTKYWTDKRAYAAYRLASTSALRRGECLALRRGDIGENILHIRHGFNYIDGLKTPKNGEERKAYILPEVKKLLMELLADNPYKTGDDQFVFYGIEADDPCNVNHFSRHLRAAMKKAGIETNGRKLDFHSLRHYVATQWANKTDLRTVAKITGHKSAAMAELYSNHIEEAETIELGRQAAKILDFRKGA